MEIPKDILEGYFCKWEQKYFEEFNRELVERGLGPVVYERYVQLLTELSAEDEGMTSYQPPRIR